MSRNPNPPRGQGQGRNFRVEREDLPTIIAKKIQKFEQTLIENFRKSEGRRSVRPSQMAYILDSIESAVDAQQSGSITPEQTKLLRQTGYLQEARKILTEMPGENQQTFIRMLTERRNREPLERIADWSPDAQAVWNPEIRQGEYDQERVLPPARGRNFTLSRAERENLDRRASARVQRRAYPSGQTEAFTRLAPPRREYTPRTPDEPIPVTPELDAYSQRRFGEPLAGPDELTTRQAATPAFMESLINAVHDPSAEGSDPSAGMRQESMARAPEFRRQNSVAFQAMMQEPAIDEYLRQRFQGSGWAELPGGVKQALYRDPEFRQVMDQEYTRGRAMSTERTVSRGLPPGEFSDDFPTRADIPSPQGDPFADAADAPNTPGARGQVQRAVGRWQGQEVQAIVDGIKAALDNGDLRGVMEGTAQYQAMIREMEQTYPGQDEFGLTITDQQRFRQGAGQESSMMRVNPAPLSMMDEMFANLTASLDSDQTGVRGLGADRDPRTGQVYPKMRREPIGMSAPDTLIPPDADEFGGGAWDLDSAASREAASSRGGRLETRPESREIRGFPADFRMPTVMPDAPTPPLPTPPDALTHFDPSTTPDLQSTPMSVPPPVAPPAASRPPIPTNSGSSLFDTILTNLQRGRTAAGDVLGNLGNVAGKGINALGVGGDILEAGELSDYYTYLQNNGLDQDETALTLGGMASIPFIGPMIFDRKKFMQEEDYRKQFFRELAVS